MKTVELLQRIDEMAGNRPEAVFQIEWSEVEECLKAELRCGEAFYAEEQYRAISEQIEISIKNIQQAVRYGDLYRLRISLAEVIGIARALPDTGIRNLKEEQANFDHAALRHYRYATTIILGDSHVNFFSGNEMIQYTPIGNGINLCRQVNGDNLTVLYLFSGLAYTCHSKDSTGEFYKKVNYLLEKFICPGSRIMVSLGEIDLRMHILKQAKLQKRDYREIIEDVLSRYMMLLRELSEKGYRVFCWGPIGSQSDSLPTDPDYPRIGTEIERNEATKYFTKRLKELCQVEEIPVLSIFDQMVTDDLRTKTEYLSADHFHLSQTAMELARPLLKKYALC